MEEFIRQAFMLVEALSPRPGCSRAELNRLPLILVFITGTCFVDFVSWPCGDKGGLDLSYGPWYDRECIITDLSRFRKTETVEALALYSPS